MRLGRTAAFSAGVFTLAAGAACSSILGIQDRSLDTAGGADGQAAETGVDGGGGDVAQGDSSTPTDSGTAEAAPCNAPCPVITGLDLPESITADSNNIYWTEFGDTSGAMNGSVKGCPLAGCGSGPKVYATAQPNAGVILTDGQNLYWSNYAGSGSTGGGIYTCPVSGCTGSPRLVVAASQPWGIAIDATFIYWVSQSDQSLHRAPKGGGSDTQLWDGGDISNLSGRSAAYLTVDDASAYIVDDWSDLYKVPLGGGNSLPLYASGSSATQGDWHLLLDPSGILFGDGTKQLLQHASTTTPASDTPFVTSLPAPYGVFRDPATGDIYWADNGSGMAADGTIGRIQADGGGKTVLVASLPDPTTLTVGGGTVYWIDQGQYDTMGNYIPNTGAIYRTPK